MRFKLGLVAFLICIAMILLMGSVLPMRAHHVPPAGTFNDTFSDVQGIVKEVRFRPPHVWIILEVKADDGELQVWPLEAASPAVLQGIGVTPEYLKAGETVKARCRRLRVVPKGHDNDCILGFLKARDGAVKDWSGNNLPPPTDF
jgi:Family of unknown function (DUF6152)